mmetsp:Transcript_17123/g.26722  ORF Transcript_17123/g.26722 Transcript_17123/m.26722 type:complete len:335 (-) Transcript_17123:26-1030(-)
MSSTESESHGNDSTSPGPSKVSNVDASDHNTSTLLVSPEVYSPKRVPTPFRKFALLGRVVSRLFGGQTRAHAARSAFKSKDTAASKQVHGSSIGEQHGGVASDYIKAIVFGALDGILTTFAIITASQGGFDDQKSISNTILVLGFANNLADAFAMGFGEYMSSSAEIDHIRAERKREEWEVETNIEGEKREMVEIYVKKGISEADARTVVDIISKDKKVFVDIMMAEELELLGGDDEGAGGRPIRQGIAIFISFFLFGSIPLLAYVTGRADNRTFAISCGLVAISLFSLGSIKGRLTNMSTFYAGSVMLFTGCVVAAISYAIGALCSHIFHITN